MPSEVNGKRTVSLAIFGYVFKTKRPGVHAYCKHPVLLLPSGPDKIWAL